MVTYMVLALAGTLVLMLITPQTLAAVGIIGYDYLQGFAIMVAFALYLPIVFVFSAATILSLIGFVRGPRGHRTRLLIWWIVVVGGSVLSEVLPPQPPQPGFALSDAMLLSCFGMSVALPCAWVWRSARG
jgi:hypothetical protein